MKTTTKLTWRPNNIRHSLFLIFWLNTFLINIIRRRHFDHPLVGNKTTSTTASSWFEKRVERKKPLCDSLAQFHDDKYILPKLRHHQNQSLWFSSPCCAFLVSFLFHSNTSSNNSLVNVIFVSSLSTSKMLETI